ncbi:hypothetical protein [Sporosarcina sp. ITBMC105]
MEKHYFTFGQNHPYTKRHQIIMAITADAARESMVRHFGWDWAFHYTENEWQECIDKGFFKNNQPLEKIYYCEEEA